MPPSSDRAATIRTVVRVASGNFLEMYDFFVFGYYAAAIGRAFFPTASGGRRIISVRNSRDSSST